MKAGRYTVNPNGRPRLYDHAKIRALILAGKKNEEISIITGSSIPNIIKLKRIWGFTQLDS